MNEKAAREIREEFANFDRNRERSSTAASIQEAIAQQQQLKDAIGDAPEVTLRKPIDLLAMKRSVAAWPRDEVEGLITYGEQMKAYATTLEKQNAKLVIHQMRDAVAELRDLGSAIPSRSVSGNPYQQARRSLSMPAGGGGGGGRSGSTAVTVNNHNNNRSLSQFSEKLFSGGNDRLAVSRNVFLGGGEDDDANVNNFEEVNGYYPPSSMMNRHSNRAMFGSPEFVTRIEMNRGVPLEDGDRSHVMNHFGEL